MRRIVDWFRRATPAPAIRFVGDLQRLEIKPGDKFVLMCDGRISAEQADQLHEYWNGFAGDGVKLLVLESGAKLGVYSAPAEAERKRLPRTGDRSGWAKRGG